jgi:hypothetical protein
MGELGVMCALCFCCWALYSCRRLCDLRACVCALPVGRDWQHSSPEKKKYIYCIYIVLCVQFGVVVFNLLPWHIQCECIEQFVLFVQSVILTNVHGEYFENEQINVRHFKSVLCCG